MFGQRMDASIFPVLPFIQASMLYNNFVNAKIKLKLKQSVNIKAWLFNYFGAT